MGNEKKINKCLMFAISKDETRPFLNGVIHYSQLKALVATNGVVATILKSRYREEIKDVIISPEFDVIEREYPKIEAVIPIKDKCKVLKFKLEKYHYRKDKRPIKLYFLTDNRIQFELPKDEDLLFVLDANNLKTIADGSEYFVMYKDRNCPIAFNLSPADTFDDMFVICPLRV